MATLKYSRQREAIKEYLSSTYEHPTADTVYQHVRLEHPNISLGTVYRNLNLLAQMGEILKISLPAGGDRFDGHTQTHYHFCCTDCGQVQDLELDSLQNVDKEAEQKINGVIDSHAILFYGTCNHCLEKNNTEKNL